MGATKYATVVGIAAAAVAISSRASSLWPQALQGLLEDRINSRRANKIQASLTALLVTAVGFCALNIKKKFTVTKPKAPPTPLVGNPEDSLVLYDYKSVPQLSGSVSNYVSKIHVFLTFAKLPYITKEASPAAGPKSKLPWIQHGPNTVPDTAFIMAYLRNTYGKGKTSGMLAPLDAEKSAKVESLIALVEQTIPYAVPHYRLIDPQGFKTLPKLMMQLGVPNNFMAKLLGATLRAGISKQLYMMGIGRHAPQDLNWLVQRDLTALSTILGSQQFLLGNEPCDADASLFAHLDVILYDGAMGKGLVDLVKQHGNLVRYAARIRKTYFADKLGEHLEDSPA